MEAFVPVIAVFVGALATAYFTSRFYVRRVTADLEQHYQQQFNERRWDAYMGFARTLRKVVQSTLGAELDARLPEILVELHHFNSQLWLVASDDVVDAVVE